MEFQFVPKELSEVKIIQGQLTSEGGDAAVR